MKYKVIFFFLLTGSTYFISAQSISNLKIKQTGNLVYVDYDLIGKNQVFKVDLYYTTDEGKTLKGPLKGVYGDIGSNIKPGINKQIIWNITSESHIYESYLQFIVNAEFGATQIQLKNRAQISKSFAKKYETGMAASLTIAVASIVTGVFTHMEGNNVYEKYSKARGDAVELRSKVELYDKLNTASYIVGGVSALTFVVCIIQHRKTKNVFAFQPISIYNGGGLMVSVRF